MSENSPITYEGVFVGRYKKRLILRQSKIEDLIELFITSIAPYDEGCLDINRINLDTGRLKFVKKINFCNELYFYKKEVKQENPNMKELKEQLKDLELYRLRWSKK